MLCCSASAEGGGGVEGVLRVWWLRVYTGGAECGAESGGVQGGAESGVQGGAEGVVCRRVLRVWCAGRC